MTRQWLLSAAAGLTLVACAGPEVEVRKIASPLSQEDLSVADRLAEATAQMRMNNVGLALESFRKALRKSPRSAMAHIGIATAYDRMGRYDLSLDHYQVALALRPDDPRMYAALAGSLRAQGRPVDAARVMAEAHTRADRGQEVVTAEALETDRAPAAFLGPPSPPELVAGSLNIVPKPLSAEAVTRGVTVRLPEARRMAGAPDAPIIGGVENIVTAGGDEMPVVDLVTLRPDVPRSGMRTDKPMLSGEALAVSSGTPVIDIRSLPPRRVDAARMVGAPPRPELVATPIEAKPLTLEVAGSARLQAPAPQVPLAPPPVDKYAMLTPVVPIEFAPKAPVIRDVPTSMSSGVEPTPGRPSVMLSAPKRKSLPARREMAPKLAQARLERLTGGEVALVTTKAPVWESRVVEKTATSTTVQFTRATVETAPVMLIAAGGTMRLAERAKEQLRTEGVEVAGADTSPTARARSVLFFPKGREEDAKALVRRFGFRIAAQVGPVDVMTLHLGRDAEAALGGA